MLARASNGGGTEPCNGPCSAHSATGCAAAQSPRRGHVITQHGLIATGPLNSPQLRLHRTQGSDRSQTQVTHRAIATAQSLRTRRGYEARNQPRVDSLRPSTALGITSCLASTHDGSASPEILRFKEANPNKSQSRWIGIFARYPLPHFADEA